MWKVNGKTWYSEEEMNKVKKRCYWMINKWEDSKNPYYQGIVIAAKIIGRSIKREIEG